MVSPMLGRSGTLSAASAVYIPLSTSPIPATQTIEARARMVMNDSGTMSNFTWHTTAAPGAGTSYDYTVMKNGVATSTTGQVAGTGQDASDIINSISYVPGDEFSLRSTPTNTPAATSVGWSYDNDSTGQCISSADAANNTSITTRVYYGFQNGSQTANVINTDPPFPSDGNIDRLYFGTSSSPGTTVGYTAVLIKNGVDTALTATIINGTQSNDTTHSVGAVAGDTFVYGIDPFGAVATVVRVRMSTRFIPTIDGESVQMFASNVSMVATTVNASGVNSGNIAWSVSENSKHNWLGTNYDVKKLYTRVSSAPTGVKTWTHMFRSGQANTTLTAQVTGAATTANDTSHTASHTGPNWFGVLTTPSGTPPVAALAWGVVTYRAPITSTFKPIVAMMM